MATSEQINNARTEAEVTLAETVEQVARGIVVIRQELRAGQLGKARETAAMMNDLVSVQRRLLAEIASNNARERDSR